MGRLKEAFRKKRAAAGTACLAALAVLCGCVKSVDPDSYSSVQASSVGGGIMMQQNVQGRDGREPYEIRTVLKEYSTINPDSRTGFYGRYTELQVEESAPDTLRSAVEECNRRAEEAVKARAEEAVASGRAGSRTDGYRFLTYGYIAAVTRADRTAFSILETELEKKDGRSSSDVEYKFRGITCDTQSGEEITLADLAGDEASWTGSIEDVLSAKYGTEGLTAADPADCAWTLDAVGIRFYFDSAAVSREKRSEIGDYTARVITAGLPFEVLKGKRAGDLSSAPESYIAMLDLGTEYNLPSGNMSILLTDKGDDLVIRIRKAGGSAEDLTIEYGDRSSDFYIIRADGAFYLFRQRIGFQEGFFYDFARPDGGFGRFAYNTCQYFDSFMREILLALPYTPYCVHMAEARRSFGESSYDKCSFVPNGHYTFPGAPDERYKRFLLSDASLALDTGNTACRLLEDFTAEEVDAEGTVIGEITVPAGRTLFFDSCVGEASRYDIPPRRSQHHTFLYTCSLTDGRRIRFESNTESTVSSEKGFFNRFTEPVYLAEARHEEAPEAGEVFTVKIGGKDYPLIPDYSLTSHTGEEIDFGSDIWWQVEGYPGRYVCTDEDMEDMKGSYFTQEALGNPENRAELVISEDGNVVFSCFGREFTGTLPEKRYYRTDVMIEMSSDAENRTFQFILREGEDHTTPTRIEFYSEGLPATNEPSMVPPLSVYLTHVPEQ